MQWCSVLSRMQIEAKSKNLIFNYFLCKLCAGGWGFEQKGYTVPALVCLFSFFSWFLHTVALMWKSPLCNVKSIINQHWYDKSCSYLGLYPKNTSGLWQRPGVHGGKIVTIYQILQYMQHLLPTVWTYKYFCELLVLWIVCLNITEVPPSCRFKTCQ